MSLLKETIEEVKNTDHNIKDIVFIGSLSGAYSCTWRKFRLLADVDYNAGYGGAKVADDLVIVFSDMSHIRRAEYDGSEWWEFIDFIKIPEVTEPVTNIFQSEVS